MSNTKRKIIYKIIIAAIIPIGFYWLFFPALGNPIDDILLIKKHSSTIGYIIDVEEKYDQVEKNNGRSLNQIGYYTYYYIYKLPSGEIIKGWNQVEYESVPDYLRNVSNKPYKVEVEFLPNKPEVSRVKGMKGNYNSLYELIRYKFSIGLVIVILYCCFVYITIKYYFKEYKKEHLNKIITKT